MGTRTFRVAFTGEIELKLDDAVIDAVDANWRKTFYDLKSPEDIAEHIAFAMLIRGFRFKQLDGFAHLVEEAARVGNDDFEVHAVEVKPKRKR